MSLQIGGSEVYLEEKGYSGLDGRADSTPAAAGSYDRVPPGGREDRDRGRAEARESTGPVLFSPQERERQVVVEQPRARGWGSDRIPPGGREGRDQGPAEAREGAWTALLSPQERDWLLGWPRVRGRGSPSHLRQPISEADCVICPLEGAPTERREHGQERRGDWDPRRERAEENRRREWERSRERLREGEDRAGLAWRRERQPRDRGESSQGRLRGLLGARDVKGRSGKDPLGDPSGRTPTGRPGGERKGARTPSGSRGAFPWIRHHRQGMEGDRSRRRGMAGQHRPLS